MTEKTPHYESQNVATIEKLLQAVTVVLLGVCAFFLRDVYTAHKELRAEFNAHVLTAEHRITSLEHK